VGQAGQKFSSPDRGGRKNRAQNSFVPAGLADLFPFHPQLKLRAIFGHRFAAKNKKRRPLLDAFAILFEEFYALSPT
jgi:hypothetical protein